MKLEIAPLEEFGQLCCYQMYDSCCALKDGDRCIFSKGVWQSRQGLECLNCSCFTPTDEYKMFFGWQADEGTVLGK